MNIYDSNSNIPFYFEKNMAKIDPQVKFITRGKDCSIFFMNKEIMFCFFDIIDGIKIPDIIRLRFKKSHIPKVIGITKINNELNTKIETSLVDKASTQIYEKIVYKNIYKNIDIEFLNMNSMLKWNCIIKPHSNPQYISLELIQCDSISLDESKCLNIQIPFERKIFFEKPSAFQNINTQQINIECNYVITKNKLVNFKLSKYNCRHKLNINNIILY